ncbi:MAG: carboxypeptidase regulatory-like domain-containing protein [Archangium sp.]|nr:carboxypeptidase regulatory-like domain-containing protein [Archangium sp.]
MPALKRSVATALVCLALSSPTLAADAQPKTCARPDVKTVARQSDAKAREAAHKGFTYLANASTEWTKRNNCFGCHVQAVTMEALTAAKYFQYDVKPADLKEMQRALKMGVTAGGHSTGVAFEGAAWARFDKFIDDSETKQLLTYADELMRIQSEDGAILDDDARLPVTGGTMQTTYQAAQTWRQAYARTANDKYLAPMRKAEKFLTRKADGWKDANAVYVQDISFALLGLASAGVTRAEPASKRLQDMLIGRQNHDGGWALDGKNSDAFATGQAIYTLKMAGFSDADPAVERGIHFLLSKQGADGAWRTAKSGQNGSEKGETMWAVLGLVTVDVASVAVSGLTDGMHVSGSSTHPSASPQGALLVLDASAIDNQSGGISELSISVDDTKVATECGPKLRFTWDTAKLTDGKHVVDVVAINGKNKQSRRRFEVFAGNVFLTEVGAVFDERASQTRVTLRNIADPKVQGQVEVEIWSLEEKSEKPKTKVRVLDAKAEPGAMSLGWDGFDAAKKQLPTGRYLAKVNFKDDKGVVKQTETALFTHASELVQKQNYGEVEGNLKLGQLGIGSSNTFVDLVDEDGTVLQTVRSTDQGNYRFKSIKPGNYKVRARKEGYAPREAPAPAKAGESSKADMAW